MRNISQVVEVSENHCYCDDLDQEEDCGFYYIKGGLTEKYYCSLFRERLDCEEKNIDGEWLTYVSPCKECASAIKI